MPVGPEGKPLSYWVGTVVADYPFYIVAESDLCREIRDLEEQLINRDIRPVDLADLPALDPGPVWFMALLVCPGDDPAEIADAFSRWREAVEQPPEPRLAWYLVPGAPESPLASAWLAADLALTASYPLEDVLTVKPKLAQDTSISERERHRRAFHSVAGEHHAEKCKDDILDLSMQGLRDLLGLG